MVSDGESLIGVGVYADHNAGIAAVCDGKLVLYCEAERLTRKKNQAGWLPDIVAESLHTLPIERVGAISCPQLDLMGDLLCIEFGARKIGSDHVEICGHPVRLLSQDHLHPHLHFLSTLLLPEVVPGVYVTVVFDAAQPQICWIDLRKPLCELPQLAFAVDSERPWYVGDIFAGLFGKLFYGTSDLSVCGKLMGLASWGRTSVRHVEALREFALREFDSTVPRWQGYWKADGEHLRRHALALFETDPRNHEDSRTLDLASAAQELFRHELTLQIGEGVERVKKQLAERDLPAPRGVLYAGGCAMSVVTNATIREVSGLPVFAPPFSHDAGQFVGGAVHAALICNSAPMPVGMGWHGIPNHSGGRVSAADVRKLGLPVHPVSPAELARRIASGGLLACLSDGAEAGPRALGNRSLLANALDPQMREHINRRVKRREWYRPLAPMLPAGAFPEYFDEAATPCSHYMMDSFSVKPQLRALLAAVTSPDGVTRAQSVDGESRAWLLDILRECGRATGHPVVLNTSLNAPGLTIAYDLSQALGDCRVLGVDAAIIHDGAIDELLLVEIAP